MRGVAVALLARLAACVPGSEPVVEPAQEPALERTEPTPTTPEPSPELPPISEILYEHHVASEGLFDLQSAGTTFPQLTIYTDGSVLRLDRQEHGSAIRRARLSPTQLEQLRELLLALAPFERTVQYNFDCPRPSTDPFEVRGTACYVQQGYQIRVGEGEWICMSGCPIEPADMLATFLAIEDLLAEIGELDSTEWTPTRGHVAVLTNEKTPGPLPWAASVQPELPYAWVVEGDEFVAAWEAAGRRTGAISKDADGWRYQITVVPWRPGEDLHDRVARLDERPFRGFLDVCDGLQKIPLRWEEREQWERDQGR